VPYVVVVPGGSLRWPWSPAMLALYRRMEEQIEQGFEAPGVRALPTRWRRSIYGTLRRRSNRGTLRPPTLSNTASALATPAALRSRAYARGVLG
jgi:hypothetical protein